MNICTADLDHPCDANDGDPCDACADVENYWRRQWAVATLAERDPERYRREMRAAGRGRLLP